MGIFATREPRQASRATAGAELTQAQQAALPPGLESVGEALAGQSRSVVEACWVVGRDLAEVGASLGESLDRLRSTTQLVRGRDPVFEETHALASAWSEVTLTYLHRISCADPMTGLASQAHLRERLAERYRGQDAGGRRGAAALVVIETQAPRDFVAHTKRITQYGEMARGVFGGSETVGRVGVRRIVVLAERDAELATRVQILRRMLDGRGMRVWIEGLPESERAATSLLDELARD